MIESIVSGVRWLLAVTRTLAGICLLGSVAINFANIIELLVLPDWVAQHVTGGVGRYEFMAQFVQWSPIIVGDGYDVALRPAHTRCFFMQNDGLARPTGCRRRCSMR